MMKRTFGRVGLGACPSAIRQCKSNNRKQGNTVTRMEMDNSVSPVRDCDREGRANGLVQVLPVFETREEENR